MERSNSTKSKAEIHEIFSILRKWGINTVGQFATLDKEELAARLGPEAVRLWERANGKSNRLLKFVRLPESFQESFEFECEIETAEPLFFMLRRFLEQLALRLNAIYLVAKEITLRITFANSRQVRQRTDSSDWRNEPAVSGKQHYEHLFKIPQPTNDVDLLFRMLQTHLENFKSEQPIVAVALTVEPIKPAFRQFGLFETALRNPQQLYETLARLSALLGTDRVGTPVSEETHRPEAFRMESFIWAVESAVLSGTFRQSGSDPDALGTAHTTTGIALRRFRPAVAASIFASANRPASRPKGSHFEGGAGSPSFFYCVCYEQGVILFEGAARQRWVRCHLQSQNVHGKIIDQRGPYLLSGNWWDEKVWARVEWDLRLENGNLVRIHRSNEAWNVDGIYD